MKIHQCIELMKREVSIDDKSELFLRNWGDMKETKKIISSRKVYLTKSEFGSLNNLFITFTEKPLSEEK